MENFIEGLMKTEVSESTAGSSSSAHPCPWSHTLTFQVSVSSGKPGAALGTLISFSEGMVAGQPEGWTPVERCDRRGFSHPVPESPVNTLT